MRQKETRPKHTPGKKGKKREGKDMKIKGQRRKRKGTQTREGSQKETGTAKESLNGRETRNIT